MKFFYLLLFTIFYTTISNAQWFQQNSGITKNLNSVFCIDSNIVFVAGDSGTILKTTNGGTNWHSQISNTNQRLISIYFIDSLIGFSVGDSGIIIKTTDGGNIWNLQNSYTNSQLNSIYFTSNDTGYVVGMNSTFIKTTNGGTDWNVDSTFGPCCYYLNSIFFTSKSKGRILGYDLPGAIILSTIDTGKTWSMYVDPEAQYNNWWLGMSMVEDTGSERIVIAGNQGSVRSLQDNCTGYWDMWGANLGNGNVTLNSVCVSKTGLWNAVGTNGTVGYFPNYGNGNQVSGVTSNLNSITFIDTLIGYVAGDSGVILKTINGGIITSIENNAITHEANLYNYPNPYSKTTIIHYKLSENSNVILKVFDITGKEVKTYVNQFQQRGKYNFYFDASNLQSGIYYYQLTIGNISDTKKMIVLK